MRGRKGSTCHGLAHQRDNPSCLFPEHRRQQTVFLAEPPAAVSSVASQQRPQPAMPQRSSSPLRSGQMQPDASCSHCFLSPQAAAAYPPLTLPGYVKSCSRATQET